MSSGLKKLVWAPVSLRLFLPSSSVLIGQFGKVSGGLNYDNTDCGQHSANRLAENLAAGCENSRPWWVLNR